MLSFYYHKETASITYEHEKTPLQLNLKPETIKPTTLLIKN